MPNWVTNRITITGGENPNTLLLDLCKKNEAGELIESTDNGGYIIDFNKIIKMPDDIYRGRFGPEEEKLYGDKNWYHWSVSNWGTKFNAYQCYICDNVAYLDTAYDPPYPVIEELAKQHPECKILHEYAEEETGYYTGYQVYENGKLIESVSHVNWSKEAYELAFELLGGSDLYQYSDKAGTYVEIEDDHEYSVEEALASIPVEEKILNDETQVKEEESACDSINPSSISYSNRAEG